MDLKTVSTDDLEQKVAERQGFLALVVPFVMEILRTCGEQLLHEEKSSHVHSIRRVIGFGSFNFHGEFGLTEMGGNTLQVRYLHTASNPSRLRGLSVLNVYFQSASDWQNCQVVDFDTDWTWQSVLRDAIKRKDEMVADFRQSLLSHACERALHAKNEEKRLGLEAEAKRLGFVK